MVSENPIVLKESRITGVTKTNRGRGIFYSRSKFEMVGVVQFRYFNIIANIKHRIFKNNFLQLPLIFENVVINEYLFMEN